MLEELGAAAKKASRRLMLATTEEKNDALLKIADQLERETDQILAANAQDLARGREQGMKESLLDRLMLNEKRIADIADGVRTVAALPDPVGEIVDDIIRPNGLHIEKVRVPIGVIGIIFEARPNVTADAAVLCLKAGNAVILRGGKEAILSNTALMKAMKDALAQSAIPVDSIALVTDTSRASADALMHLNNYLDLLIPRGGAGLIHAAVENSTVPVIATGLGNCHVYVDSPCSNEMAVNIIDNSKTSRVSVCNAAETLLIHKDKAELLLPAIKTRLDLHHVELRGCEETRRILGDSVVPVTDEDYATEFNDYILAVRVVDSVQQAVDHIAQYSTGHSDCIVTSSEEHAAQFVNAVDSAAVYVNASTRFTDGGEFGFGAEIGISTQKLHARGPMGLRELTSCKYIVHGNGQIR